MTAIRHDRSVIAEYGGVWPEIADRVRDETASIADSPSVSVRRHQLRARRLALGLTQRALSALVGRPGYTDTTISNAENGEQQKRSEEWWTRIEAVLAKAEETQRHPSGTNTPARGSEGGRNG